MIAARRALSHSRWLPLRLRCGTLRKPIGCARLRQALKTVQLGDALRVSLRWRRRTATTGVPHHRPIFSLKTFAVQQHLHRHVGGASRHTSHHTSRYTSHYTLPYTLHASLHVHWPLLAAASVALDKAMSNATARGRAFLSRRAVDRADALRQQRQSLSILRRAEPVVSAKRTTALQHVDRLSSRHWAALSGMPPVRILGVIPTPRPAAAKIGRSYSRRDMSGPQARQRTERTTTQETTSAQRQAAEAPTEMPVTERSVRPVALVWRRREPAAASNDAAGRAQIDFPKPVQPSAVVQSAAAPPAITATSTRQDAAAKPFDAATVDRLAEDVLQRVDKRLRIERERRGI